jgi:RimJ/RimL family protein N-acetyltransferase
MYVTASGSSAALSERRYSASADTFSVVRDVAAMRAATSLQRRIWPMVAVGALGPVLYDRAVGGTMPSADLSDRDLWHPPQIVGRRVGLRRPEPADLNALVRWYRDPEIARLTRYQTRPMTQAEIERFFQVRMLAPDALAYSIVELPMWRLIGFTTFSSLDGDNGSVLFHITIGERDGWGRGLGTEATELMVGHAFEGLGLHRVGLAVFSYNERAIRAYEKAGFQVEGRLRDAILREGRYYDEVQMGVLESEWSARRPTGAMPDEALVG